MQTFKGGLHISLTFDILPLEHTHARASAKKINNDKGEYIKHIMSLRYIYILYV